MKLSPVLKALKDEMEQRELSIQQLATLADVSFSNLYDIFRGDKNPTIETIEKVARALKMKVTAA